MTTSAIHPIVLEKLQRFRRQRRRLILWRGFCSTLAIWLGTMMALALVDRLVVLPDSLRMGLSLAGYVATAVMFWVECGRYLTHQPDVRELARLVELAAPQLREELLSAVELAESDAHWDSAEFRAALQQATAQDVGALQIDHLLTGKLIAGWLYAALAAGGVLLLLLVVPGLRFTQSFARAALPGANLARYSSVQISVLAPTPPDQIVPEGDSLPVIVSLAGPDVQEVILETIPHRGPRERTLMSLSAVNQFTAAVQLNQQPVQFRIHARDAITRLYTLTPRPRPHVVRFQKTYQYPVYSRLPAKTVTEENGDLDALEGTTVELNLEVDQPIKEASLQLETGSGKTVKQEIPLSREPSGHLIARVPLTAPGIYQVRLVAAQTDFENKYSPQYEIRVRPDLLPFARIDRPERDQVLPPDSLVNLTGSANDDFGLAHIAQAIQVNQGEWKMFPLTQTGTGEVKVSRRWDLFELGIRPGDRILTKLVATDLKGQRGESAPLRIMIASAGFDPNRLKELQERQALNQSIHELRELADQLDAKTREARTAVNAPATDTLQKQQALLAATTAAVATERKADEVLRQIKDALPRADTARESADLALVGNAISRAKHEGVQATKAALERATENTKAGNDKAAKNDVEKIAEPLAAVALVRVADDTHRQLLAASAANSGLRDLQQLATEQRTLNDHLRTATDDPAQVERATHRLAVAADQAKSLEQQLKTLADNTVGNPANMARNLAQDLARNRENIERALTNTPTAEKLKLPADQMQKNVENAATAMRNMELELSLRTDTARKALQDQTGTTADVVAKLADQLRRQDSPAPKTENWQTAAAQLKDRAALEERRPHADAPFANTVARTADALQALQDATGSDQPSSNTVASVKAIEQAVRQIQTGHALEEQVTALRQLSAKELWEKPATPADNAERANDWKWSQQQLDRIQAPLEAKRALDTATKSPTAQQIGNELNQRRSNPAAGNNLAEPLAKLAGDVEQVKQQLQPAMEQARAEIEKRAPALSERLAGLSRTAEKLKAETSAQARQADKPENTNQVRAEAQNLATTQQHLDNRIEDVKDTLRRDANAQNLATDEGRARARDADDAVAILRQKPVPTAAELLQNAATTTQPEQQQSDLKDAAKQQAKLADDLKHLAEHYKNTEAGHPELTRAGLRETEKELGLKPALDAEYAKAQALENLAGLPPEQQLVELERTLQDSQPMRQALSEIAQTTLQSAATDLQKSAEKERQIAQLPMIEQAKRIAAEAQKLSRQDIPAVAKKTGDVAKPELTTAGQKLAGVAQNIPQDSTKPPEQVAQQMQNQVAPLQQAAADLDKAAVKLEATAPAAAEQTRQASEQAKQLAQQTGQLANALNPAPPQEQANQIAEAAQKLAQQDVPAIAQKAGPTGETAKPQLTQATQNLAHVGKDLPQDAAKSPDQLAKALQKQVAPLQQAATELNTAATKINQAAEDAQQKADAATQQAKADPTNADAAKQAQAAQQQAKAAAQQAQAAQQQAQQASQQAERLAQQAGQLANTLNENKPQLQAKHIAEEAQKLAKQDIPAVVANAGETAKPELTNAGQKLEAVAQTTPRDFSKPPEQLAQAMQNQVAPLQQAATDLNTAAKKLEQATQAAQQKADAADKQLQQAKTNNAGEAAVKQAESAQQQAQAEAQQSKTAQQQAQQAGQKAAELAQQASRLANDLNQNKPAQQAQRIADAAQKLAQQSVPALAAKAGDAAKPELTEAGQKLASVAQNTPRDFSKPPEQLAQQMQNQVEPLQQAAADLDKAAGKLEQAAQQNVDAAKASNASPETIQQAEAAQQQAQATAQQTRQASEQTAQLAKQADQLANALNPTKSSPVPTVAQAKQIAAEAQKLARQDLPALAQQAGPTAKPELTTAGQKLEAAAQNIPQDFSKPPEQLVQQMQNQIAPLQQAATDLNNAATKLDQAAQAAQQKAEAAAQQAKASNATPAAIQQAETAQAAAQQAQTAKQQAQQAAQQAGQLAKQTAQLADALNRTKPQLQALAQQPAIEEAVRTAGNDIERAGRHETRLGQEDKGQNLQDLGQKIESQTGAQIAQAADNIANANSPAQLQPAAQAAREAIESAQNDVDAALQQSPTSASPATTPTDAPSQLAAAPDEAAKWMARALDSLDATLNPASAPASSQPAPAGQPNLAAQSATAFAAKTAAQAQSANMMSARSSGLAPGEQAVAQAAGQTGPGGGGNGAADKPLPEVKLTGGNWGKLPAKLARDLLDSQREGVGGEYREMVEMYFRAIADKAQEKQP